MTRHNDWRSRLAVYIARVQHQSFRPGQHDCALFAAGAVEAMTGVDLAEGMRGYSTIEQGQEFLRRHGFADHVDVAARRLPEVPPIMAQVGDVAAVSENGSAALGVVQGPMIYVLRLDGLGLVPLTSAERAFRV